MGDGSMRVCPMGSIESTSGCWVASGRGLYTLDVGDCSCMPMPREQTVDIWHAQIELRTLFLAELELGRLPQSGCSGLAQLCKARQKQRCEYAASEAGRDEVGNTSMAMSTIEAESQGRAVAAGQRVPGPG